MSGREQCEGPPNGGGNRRCIAVDGDKLGAGLLGARCRYAAHRIHHRAELEGPVDTCADICEAFGHGSLAALGSAAGVMV